jgi:hypothetical protein
VGRVSDEKLERKTHPSGRAWDKDGNEIPLDEWLREHWRQYLEKATREREKK